jgi:rubrerythrin
VAHSNNVRNVMDGNGDRELLLEALELERQAVRRYASHAAGTSDPRLVAYWESLRRNESEHRDLLTKELRRLGVTVPPETQDREAPGPGADPNEVGR